jgi:GntR family transcriptional regulator
LSGARPPDRNSPLPLWAQVLEDLQRRLAAGEFRGGFPPDRELMTDYDVSRHTAREAVRRLQDTGVIERERGRGTFVREPDIEQSMGPLYSLFRSIESQGFAQRSEVLTFELRTDPVAADQLGLNVRDQVVYLQRIRFANDVAIALDESWLPASIARKLLKVDFEYAALYEELERVASIRPNGGWERIRPALPSAAECKLLGADMTKPVFLVERVTDADGMPVESRRTVIRGDRYAFITRWPDAHRAEPILDSR